MLEEETPTRLKQRQMSFSFGRANLPEFCKKDFQLQFKLNHYTIVVMARFVHETILLQDKHKALAVESKQTSVAEHELRKAQPFIDRPSNVNIKKEEEDSGDYLQIARERVRARVLTKQHEHKQLDTQVCFCFFFLFYCTQLTTNKKYECKSILRSLLEPKKSVIIKYNMNVIVVSTII